jgi:hypothetical protein
MREKPKRQRRLGFLAAGGEGNNRDLFVFKKPARCDRRRVKAFRGSFAQRTKVELHKKRCAGGYSRLSISEWAPGINGCGHGLQDAVGALRASTTADSGTLNPEI